MEGETALTLATIISSLGTMSTGMFTMATAVMDWVASNALALFMFLVPVIGLGIGAVNRVLRR